MDRDLLATPPVVVKGRIIKAEDWRMITPEEWPWKHFRPFELACRGTGSLVVSSWFMDRLEELRVELDEPMRINSGYRTEEYNYDVGGHPNSLHMEKSHPTKRAKRGLIGTLAVDVSTERGGFYRGELFDMAWRMDWSIGWGAQEKFLHLDRRLDIGFPRTSFDY